MVSEILNECSIYSNVLRSHLCQAVLHYVQCIIGYGQEIHTARSEA